MIRVTIQVVVDIEIQTNIEDIVSGPKSIHSAIKPGNELTTPNNVIKTNDNTLSTAT